MNERTLGKVEEGIEWLKGEVREIKDDVKALNQFKWKMAGAYGVLILLVEVARVWAGK